MSRAARRSAQESCLIRRNAAALILNLVYGWKVTDNDDRFTSMLPIAFESNARLSLPGRWWVEGMPFFGLECVSYLNGFQEQYHLTGPNGKYKAAFTIARPLDERGEEFIPPPEYENVGILW
ncbi:hypothetical protein P692DRAFT_20880812 [Suillus brevipes Sb2]|nr:hypothetical protein P692DRAFT_20880812 [Suillus brevipes Sb2]